MSSNRGRVATAEHAPRQSRLLAGLPAEDYERLLPHLELVALPLGAIIHGAGDAEKYLYFITEGIVSRVFVSQSGASAGFAVTGKEGVIGVATFLGGDSMPSQAVVTSPGFAYRLRADALADEFDGHLALRHLLLRFTQALIAQAGQIAVCNRHHPVEKQLCRWILSCLDRLPSNELVMTQELIAGVLGVRREGVTEAAGKLQKEGLIHYNRGRITVLDRAKLEAKVCECRAVIKREYDRLLEAEKVIGKAGPHGTIR
ncbi:MAG: Crp/Fnr family transcriptional regulator [Betaproteobacteria bacterium]